METVFLTIVNMSITASWIAVAVMILRLLLKKAPKAICVILWALVGMRLICPFSIESVFSLIPSAETVPQDILYSQTPTIHSGIPIVNETINPILSNNLSPTIDASVKPMQTVASAASVAWLVGIAAMLLYTVISYVRIRRSVNEAVPHQDNVWLCDRIDTPFILGVIRPRIYLPSAMNETDIPYVIAHENAHLKRRDHLWKPLGFLLLAVYWFNPILWVAYVLLCKDIELACDEKVIKELGADGKKPYSEALINCSLPRKRIAACPLAFGEVGVKGRIKSVLDYKKPAFWMIVAAVIASIAVAVCFLTNPKQEEPPSEQAERMTLQPTEIVCFDGTGSYVPSVKDVPTYTLTNKMQLLEKLYDERSVLIGTFEEIALTNDTFDSLFTAAVWLTEDTVKSLKTDNKHLWQLYSDYDGGLYILMEQKDGTFYLGLGFYNGEVGYPANPDRSSIYYLCKVEKIAENTTPSTTATTLPAPDYTGVPLNMPECVAITGGYPGITTVAMPYNANTVKFISDMDGWSELVELSEDCILELNKLYEAVTDFSRDPLCEWSETQVIVFVDGEKHTFYDGYANQDELNRYVDLLFSCESADGEKNPYPQEQANQELEEFWEECRKRIEVTKSTMSDYTGVALNMPEYISKVFESYDHTAFTKVVPYSANVVKILSSEGSPAYVELSEERIKELNALYESITEFKDYTGSIGADPTISIRRNGETHYLGWGCATERALNLYIDKILNCDASDEEWREIDNTEYYSDLINETFPTHNSDVPSYTYTGVPLKMPDSVSHWYSSYASDMMWAASLFSDNVIQFTYTTLDGSLEGNREDDEICFCELSEEQVLELNALYDAITDFSGTGGSDVEVTYQGKRYRFARGYAYQRPLNLYIEKLLTLTVDDEQWWKDSDNTTFPIEKRGMLGFPRY